MGLDALARGGLARGRVLGLLGIALGMAGGELALAAVAYVIAYELLGSPVPGIRRAILGLAPVAALGAVYVFIYRTMGYGGAGSGLYIHPLQNTGEFLAAAMTRVPTLLASGVLGVSADLWFAKPGARSLQVAAGCAAVLVLLGLLRLCWLDLEVPTRRALRWLLAGSFLSLIPIVAAFPSDRMLLVPGIGVAAALAVIMTRAFRYWRTRGRRLLIGAGVALAFGHVLLAPIFAVAVQTILIRQSRESLEIAASPAVRDSGGRETVLVFAPDYVVSLYMPLLIDFSGGPAPRSWRPLSIAPCDHKLRRTGPRTLGPAGF